MEIFKYKEVPSLGILKNDILSLDSSGVQKYFQNF